MITAELAQKIETLADDEYRMVENYVNNVVEYSKRRKREAAWGKIKSDLVKSEERMEREGCISSGELREKLGVGYVQYCLLSGRSRKAGCISLPVKTLYDVEAGYEKYYLIFSNKNYFLYYIEGNTVNVMEMYDEREDYARDMFGIITTTQETLDYWGE